MTAWVSAVNEQVGHDLLDVLERDGADPVEDGAERAAHVHDHAIAADQRNLSPTRRISVPRQSIEIPQTRDVCCTTRFPDQAPTY